MRIYELSLNHYQKNFIEQKIYFYNHNHNNAFYHLVTFKYLIMKEIDSIIE